MLVRRLLVACLTIAMTCALAFAPAIPAYGQNQHEPDVVVYGGTAGGIVAAVAAAREGKTVALVEASKHLGGMVSGGLGATDVGNGKAIGGYAREFFDRVRAYYA